jgi:hypothetical protein
MVILTIVYTSWNSSCVTAACLEQLGCEGLLTKKEVAITAGSDRWWPSC